jgi:hypothetical protein
MISLVDNKNGFLNIFNLHEDIKNPIKICVLLKVDFNGFIQILFFLKLIVNALNSKNVDFIIENIDFIIENVDFIIENVDFRMVWCKVVSGIELRSPCLL